MMSAQTNLSAVLYKKGDLRLVSKQAASILIKTTTAKIHKQMHAKPSETHRSAKNDGALVMRLI